MYPYLNHEVQHFRTSFRTACGLASLVLANVCVLSIIQHVKFWKKTLDNVIVDSCFSGLGYVLVIVNGVLCNGVSLSSVI